MALAIKSIPVLKGREAQRFIEKAEHNEKNKGTIDLSHKVQMFKKIIKNSNLK